MSHTQVRQPRSKRPYERTIVQRTRLLEILERADGRTILLVGPAGYGKTTLAHQWLERVGGAWVSVTAASGDIPVLARDLAAAIGELYPLDARRIETALQAGGSPADQARAVARTILAQVRDPVDLWMVIDDYQFLGGNPAAEELISRLERSGKFKLLVTSRERPAWATSRQRVHLDTLELGASELAMDEQEVAQLLPPDRRTVAIRREARGWPAVIALAAHAQLSGVATSADSLSATLYDYFAQELFDAAPAEAQRGLAAAAVLPPLPPAELSAFLGHRSSAVEVAATGLAYEEAGRIEIHPLARSFLLAKLHEREDARWLAMGAFELALSKKLYDQAFEVVKGAGLDGQIERLIVTSYTDLIETGRIATLEELGRYARAHDGVSQPIFDIIAADVGLVEGRYDQAQGHAEAAAGAFPSSHPLKARACILAGRAAHMAYRLEQALDLYAIAEGHAVARNDVHEVAWGKCLAAMYLEDDRASALALEFEALTQSRPIDRIRVAEIRMQLAFLGITRSLHDFEPDLDGLVALVADPWVRSSWSNLYGYSLILQGRYEKARKLLRAALIEVNEAGLPFGLSHFEWSLAAAELGLRHFARADALLGRVERRLNATDNPSVHAELNARSLRARLHLAQQRPQEAVRATADEYDVAPSRAMYGEYLATRALALAMVGAAADAVETAERAESMTQSSEVHVLTAAVFAIVEIVREPKRGDPAETLLETASSRGVWDGVVCACRASPELLVRLATYPRYRSQLRQTMLRAREDAIAASAGLVTRQTGTQRTLSPREREVMEFVRQGSRDADIAASLFISVATVKRHLHNAYAKLGATNRTEATARYAEIENAEAETLASDTRWEV